MWRELSSPLETSLTFSDRKEQAATLPCNGVENNSRSHLPDFYFFFFHTPLVTCGCARLTARYQVSLQLIHLQALVILSVSPQPGLK